jgi:hypothetical protein
MFEKLLLFKCRLTGRLQELGGDPNSRSYCAVDARIVVIIRSVITIWSFKHPPKLSIQYDPDKIDLTGWMRRGDRLESIDEVEGWVSPKLMIRFELQPDNLAIYRPDGEKFLGFVELDRQRQFAEEQRQFAEEKATRLAAKLRELGVDPDNID